MVIEKIKDNIACNPIESSRKFGCFCNHYPLLLQQIRDLVYETLNWTNINKN